MKQNVYRVGGIYFKMKHVVEMYPGVFGNLHSPGLLFLLEGMDASYKSRKAKGPIMPQVQAGVTLIIKNAEVAWSRNLQKQDGQRVLKCSYMVHR